MKLSLVLFGAFLLLLPVAAEGARKTNIRRGGQGFLFPDHNQLVNPGQFAIAHGVAVETAYTRVNGSDTESVTPSLVYGNGRLGFGLGGTRIGPDLRDGSSSVDVANVGLGVAMLKSRLTLGGSYTRLISPAPTGDGAVQGTLTFNSPGRSGPAVGLGYTTDLSNSLQAATAGIGYSFSTNTTLELNFDLNNLSATDDWTAAFCFGFGNNWMYFGSRLAHAAVSSAQNLSVRLGFVLGRYIDISFIASQQLQSGGGASYGASLRASF